MAFIKTGKTNWKYILIIFILSVFTGGSILLWAKMQEVPFTRLPEITKSEKPFPNENSDWKTYKNEEYGFELKYPPYIKVGLDAPNSVIGTYDKPIGGIYVGNLVFVIADDEALKKETENYFNQYFSMAANPEPCEDGPCAYCSNETENIKNNFVNISAVSCGGEGGPAFYALIKGERMNVFIDGYSGGWGFDDSKNYEALGIFEEGDENKILSTFEFIEKTAVQPLDELLSAEVRKLEKANEEKYRIESKKEFRIENNDYLMTTFQIDEAAGGVFKIYKIDNNYLIDLFERGEYSIGGDLEDIDNDGAPEVVLGMSTGGNCWSCSWISILKIKNGKVEPILIDFPKGVVPREVQDLDNDGIMEIIGVDTHWEFYKNVCHACSPYVSIIASFENGDYRISSYKFPDFYNAEITDIQTKLENPFNEEYYFGGLISLLLNYIVQDKKEFGFLAFQKYADAYTFESPTLKAEIDRIKSNLDAWIREEGVDKLTGFPVE